VRIFHGYNVSLGLVILLWEPACRRWGRHWQQNFGQVTAMGR